MSNKLSVMDVKQAIWDKRFRDLFPEYKGALEKFLKDPGCGCNVALVKTLMRQKDKLKQYFPTKDIVTPEEEEKDLAKNDWGVINCPIVELEDNLRAMPRSKRMVAAARYKDRVTVVTNDIASYYNISSKEVKQQIDNANTTDVHWKVINTTKDELLDELRKLPEGRKSITLTRYKDKITVITNDLSVLF